MITRSRQRGLSLLGWVVVLIVLAVFGTAAFRMVPAYMDYYALSGTINNVLERNGIAMMSEAELRRVLSDQMNIDRAEAVNVRDLAISKSGARFQVGFEYEVRKPLFYNVSVVMHFENTLSNDTAP